MNEIKPLTSLRGIFAMWVVVFHLGVGSPVAGWDHLPVISRGYLAVDFFFVLSGFILTISHGADFFRLSARGAYLEFVLKRAGRLFPLHWVVLLACVAGLVILGDPIPWRVYIAGEAALVHRWNLFPASMSAINGPDWSISTELAANLLFPAFIMLGMRQALPAIAMGAACISAIVFVAWRHGWTMDAGDARSWLPLIRCFGEFGVGVLLARRQPPQWIAHDIVIGFLGLGLLSSIILKIDLAAIAFLILLLVSFTLDKGYIVRVLSVAPLYWLGRISYSIYMTQLPVLMLVRKGARHFPSFFGPIYIIGTLVAVLIVSGLSYHFVEKTAGNIIRKLLVR